MHMSTRSRLFGSLTALLLSAAALPAATTPYVATVVQAEVEVRCKPSTDPKLYATNRLRQGARVLVLEETSDGWLGIQPPPSSFSWVNAKQIERIVPNQANYVVKSDNVSVLMGGDVVNVRPSVESIKLARGTQVHVIGQEVPDGDVVWLPIDPPVGEKRYVRGEAVRMETLLAGQTPAAAPVGRLEDTVKPAAPNFAIPTNRMAAKDNLAIPVSASVNVAAPPANATPWQKAEFLERQGRWQEASQIYDQLGRDLLRDYPQWADFANRRAAYLRNGGNVPLNVSALQGKPVQATSTFQAAVQTGPAVQVRLSPPSDPLTQPPAQTSSWSSPQTTPQGAASSGPGRLVRSGYYRSGGAPYRLETTRGYIYAAPAQGVDLEPYVDRNIELVGTWQYVGELKAYYMVVSRVQAL